MFSNVFECFSKRTASYAFFLIVTAFCSVVFICSAIANTAIAAPPEAAYGEFIVKFNAETISSLRESHPELKSYSIEQIRVALGHILDMQETKNLDLIDAKLLKLNKGSEVDALTAVDLLDGGFIDYLEPNYLIKINQITNDTYSSMLWGMHNVGQSGGTIDVDINAVEAWEVTTGSEEIVVGIVDTGVDYNHKDLSENMWRNELEVNGRSGIDDDHNGVIDDIYGYNSVADNGDPMDDNNHGTHCAGVVGAVGNNELGVVGVNWKVRIMALKFLDSAGAGYSDEAIRVMEYAVAMKRKGVNLRVLSNSWGGGSYQQAIFDAIEKCAKENILVVAAAGNDAANNDDFPTYPADYEIDGVMSVAAVGRDGALAWFSNYGAKSVDIAAPGVSIISTVRNNNYASFSGTSMATPYVSGVAALVLAKDNTIAATSLMELLKGSVKTLQGLRGKTITEGIIDAKASLSGKANHTPQITPMSDLIIDEIDYNLAVLAEDPDGDSLTYSAEVDTIDSLAYNLDYSLGLWSDGEFYQNSWGLQEKWLRDKTNKWYFIKPDGILYRFDNVNSVPLVASLSQSYYLNPMTLCEADKTYVSPVDLEFNGNRLSIHPKGEFKGLVKVSVSDGRMIADTSFELTIVRNSPPILADMRDITAVKGQVIQLSASASDSDGDTLHFSATVQNINGVAPAQVKVNSNILTITPNENFVGNFDVTLFVSDGVGTDSTSFNVTVVNETDKSVHEIDSDGDGVSDASEAIDGTDIYDAGSFKGTLPNPAYALWNSFLDMQNILELVNTDSKNATARLFLYAVDGSLAYTTTITIPSYSQKDLILNSIDGFKTNSYGIVKITHSGVLDGRISYYRKDAQGGFDFAFSVGFTNPTLGTSSVGFNTFQPSLNAQDSNLIVENWLSVVNLSENAARFIVNSYNQNGELLKSNMLKVSPFMRIDVDGGHGFAGAGVVGLHEIIPLDSNTQYISQLIRYGRNQNLGYNFAFPLGAKAGNGRPLHMPISRLHGSDNWIEVANTLNLSEHITVKFFNSLGEEVSTQNLKLNSHAQTHLNAASYLSDGESGSVIVTSEHLNSIVAQSMFYFRNTTGGISAMYGTQAKESLGNNLTASYNLFLGMNNWLKLSNTSNSDINILIKVQSASFNTSELNTEYEVTILAHSSIDVALHDSRELKVEPNSYGSISLTTQTSNSIIAELIRTRSISDELDFAMPTLVR